MHKPAPEAPVLPRKRREIGKLVVIVLRGQHLQPSTAEDADAELYCSVDLTECGEAAKRTRVDAGGGQHPVWDEEFRFTVYELEGEQQPFPRLNLSVKAKSRNAEDDSDLLVGQAAVLVNGSWKEFDDWVEIKDGGKCKGEVFLEMTYYPAVAAPAPLQRRPSKLNPQVRIQRGPILPLPADNPSGRFNPAPRPRPQSGAPSSQHAAGPAARLGHGGPAVAPKSTTARAFRAPQPHVPIPAPLPLPGDPEPPEIPAFLRPGRQPAPLVADPPLSVEAATLIAADSTGARSDGPTNAVPTSPISGTVGAESSLAQRMSQHTAQNNAQSGPPPPPVVLASTQPYGATMPNGYVLPSAKRAEQGTVDATSRPSPRPYIQVHSDPHILQTRPDPAPASRPQLPPSNKSSPDSPSRDQGAYQYLPATEHLFPQHDRPDGFDIAGRPSQYPLSALGHDIPHASTAPAVKQGWHGAAQLPQINRQSQAPPTIGHSLVASNESPAMRTSSANWQSGPQYAPATSVPSSLLSSAPYRREPAPPQSSQYPNNHPPASFEQPPPRPAPPSTPARSLSPSGQLQSGGATSPRVRGTASSESTQRMPGAYVRDASPPPPLPPKTPLPPPLPASPGRQEVRQPVATSSGSAMTKIEEFERERAAARERETADRSHFATPSSRDDVEWRQEDVPPLYSATDSGKGKQPERRPEQRTPTNSTERPPRTSSASTSSQAFDRVHAGQAALAARIKQEQEDARMAAQLARESEEREMLVRRERERRADEEFAKMMREEEERQRQREREDEELAQRMAQEASGEEEQRMMRVEADERLARSLAENEQPA